jgi:hypothetical protein
VWRRTTSAASEQSRHDLEKPTMSDDQSFIVCSNAEIFIVAKLEKVSDTAYGKMISSLCLIAPQV